MGGAGRTTPAPPELREAECLWYEVGINDESPHADFVV
jgi:hypothetical protein